MAWQCIGTNASEWRHLLYQQNAGEAECAGVFMLAQKKEVLRTSLKVMGYCHDLQPTFAVTITMQSEYRLTQSNRKIKSY